jgi:sugar phosphate isomerase/epimerase
MQHCKNGWKPGPMIETVFVAPKACTETEAIALAQRQLCGLELDTFFQPTALDSKHTIHRLQHALAQFSGPLSLHGPVMDLNPVSRDPAIAKASRKRYIQAVEAALALNARFLVFHSQWNPLFTKIGYQTQWLEESAAFFSQLIANHVQGTPLTLVLENFMDETPQGLSDLVNEVNSAHFRACLDVGHVNLFSQQSPAEWFDVLGHQIATIHLHNNDGQTDEHTGLNEGTLDLEGFVYHVGRSHHKVQLMLEVNGIDSVTRSLEGLRPFLEASRSKRLAHSFLI